MIPKEKYEKAVITDLNNSTSQQKTARKLFISYPTSVFDNLEDLQFDILNTIASQFYIPLTNVLIVGSAKLGYSYINNRDFIKGKSDLDVAIVSDQLFTRYSELSCKVTRTYSDLTSFGAGERGTQEYKRFTENLIRGMFRPDLMPNCRQKNEWFKFFNELSNRHYKLFKNINASIYLSSFFLENKQSSIVNKIMETIKK